MGQVVQQAASPGSKALAAKAAVMAAAGNAAEIARYLPFLLSGKMYAVGILGSGEVALILDAQALLSCSAKTEAHAAQRATGMRRLQVH